MMKKWYKLIAGFLMMLMMVSVLAGCRQNASPIELSKLKNDGGFAYAGTPWGGDAETVVAQVDALLENYPGLEGNRPGEALYVVEGLPFEGEEWHGEWQFDDDGFLWCVSFLLETSGKEGEKLYKKLSAELETLYGEANEAVYLPAEFHYSLRPELAENRYAKKWYSTDKKTRLGLVRYDKDGVSSTVGIVLMGREEEFTLPTT